MDKITVGIPTYNSSKYLRASLDSLLNQSYENIEFIASDNCSTDDTQDILNQYKTKFPNLKIHIQKENIGAPANFKFLINESSNDSTYFMWAASDDMWSKDFIKNIIAEMKKTNSAVGFASTIQVDDSGKVISKPKTVDLSSSFLFVRFIKFLFYFDDSFFYGVHKKEIAKKISLPKWKGFLGQYLLNIAYPFLLEVLINGNFAIAKNEAWYNRRHQNKHYIMSSKERKTNMLIRANCYLECLKRLSAKNLIYALAALPFFLFHYLIFSYRIFKDYVRVTFFSAR